MTVDKLIERLEWMRAQVGGECEVRVIDDEGEYGFAVTKRSTLDPKCETGVGNVVYLDLTGQPK